MRKIFREKIFICGDYLEADIFPVFSVQSARGKKKKATPEVMKRYNKRQAERKLIRLLNTNFTEKDIKFDITYDPDHLPVNLKEAQKQLYNFLRRVKRARKKAGLEELKYVTVTEQGKKSGRIHHHIVMSGGLSINELADLWGRGYTQAKPLQFMENGLEGLARYMIKDPEGTKRWNASKNLKKPEEKTRDGKVSKKKVVEWSLKGFELKAEIEKEYPGYRLIESMPYFNDVNKSPYLTLFMVKKPDKPRKGSLNARRCKAADLPGMRGNNAKVKHKD